MSKKFPVFLGLITVSLLPLLTLILYPFGYSVTLASYKILSAVSAVICIITGYMLKNYTPDKTDRTLLSLLPVFQFINATIYISKSKSLITAVFMSICFIMCAAISEKSINSDKTKIFSVMTSSLLFVAFVLVSFVTVFFGSFSENMIVKSAVSPNGEYCAEVIDSDDGALGGDTFVQVRKYKRLNLLVLRIGKRPELIYRGEWGEYETMEIKWLNDNSLLINSTEYNIST